MLQMVRTLAQFSIALEEMNENGGNTGDEVGGGGEKDGRAAQVVGRDAVDQLKTNGNGNSSQNLNGNGLSAGSPNVEVDSSLVLFCFCFFVFLMKEHVCCVSSH